MKIQFISHAGVIVKTNGISILIDPWTCSKTFNNGWALHSPAAKVNYDQIDYIFVSHEHPDHFNFPTLNSISLENRSKIKILYQRHASSRLKEAFIKLSFSEVIELPIYKWFRLDEIDLFCGSAGSMDSFLTIKSEGRTILNLNDCVFNKNQYKYIKNCVGNVDFLFTQFSFADWVGNDSDEVEASARKVNDIKLQKDIFKPIYIIPFASFVYFCNVENQRMNSWANTPQYIQSLQIEGLNFMYPGDEIDCHNPYFDSNSAVRRYSIDLASIKIDPLPPSVSLEYVGRAITDNILKFRSKILFPFICFVSPFTIFLHDLEKIILVDPRKGFWRECENEKARYEMCSQVCWYTFNFSWGTGTLFVSGMFKDNEFPKRNSYYFFFQNLISTSFFSFSSLKNTLRTIQFLWSKRVELFYRFL